MLCNVFLSRWSFQIAFYWLYKPFNSSTYPVSSKQKRRRYLITIIFTWPSFYEKKWQVIAPLKLDKIMPSYCFFTGYMIVPLEGYTSLQFSMHEKWKNRLGKERKRKQTDWSLKGREKTNKQNITLMSLNWENCCISLRNALAVWNLVLHYYCLFQVSNRM